MVTVAARTLRVRGGIINMHIDVWSDLVCPWHESLVALGAEAGLDADDVARALRDNAYAKAVEADLEQARAIQVNGVPFFLFDGRYAVAGAQPADAFTQALSRVPADIS